MFRWVNIAGLPLSRVPQLGVSCLRCCRAPTPRLEAAIGLQQRSLETGPKYREHLRDAESLPQGAPTLRRVFGCSARKQMPKKLRDPAAVSIPCRPSAIEAAALFYAGCRCGRPCCGTHLALAIKSGFEFLSRNQPIGQAAIGEHADGESAARAIVARHNHPLLPLGLRITAIVTMHVELADALGLLASVGFVETGFANLHPSTTTTSADENNASPEGDHFFRSGKPRLPRPEKMKIHPVSRISRN